MTTTEAGETPLDRLKRIRSEIAAGRAAPRTPYHQALDAQRRERDAQSRRESFTVLRGGRDDA